MTRVKRLEITTGSQELDRVLNVLRQHGITGYVVVRDVRGGGDRRIDSMDALTGEVQNRLILTTCPPEQIDPLVESLRALLNRYGGSCVFYDAECVVHCPGAVGASR